MDLVNVVNKSSLLSNGCKRYYNYINNVNKASKINNWLILDGKHRNKNFVIIKDTLVSKTLNIGLTSIYNYKKTLKSLGLIDTLQKFTTRTNQCRNKHYCQLTVLTPSIPRKLLSKMLKHNSKIKTIIQKTYTTIITHAKQKLNKSIKNLHTRILNTIDKAKTTITEINSVQAVLDSNKVKYNKHELYKYVKLYNQSQDIFTLTSKLCTGKDMYAPYCYFRSVFTYTINKSCNYTKKTKTNKFTNFPQRVYDFNALEKLLFE